jgi:adenosine deaminase
VKETKYNQSHQEPKFKEVLKNGVRITLESDWDVPTDVIDGVLEYGTKNPTD